MPTFKFDKREPIIIGKHRSLEEACTAVREQLELVKSGKSTARVSMAYLLNTYPVLRKDRRGSVSHPLLPLVDAYVAEHFASRG